MGLDFAIDALYQTDFKPWDAVDCKVHKDGRAYPTVQAVGECFERAGAGLPTSSMNGGYSLTIRHVQLFDCYRAEWRDGNGDVRGAVVGQTAEEAAVYALSLLRRQLQGV